MKLISFFAVCVVLLGSSCAKKLDLYPTTGISPESVQPSDLPALRLGVYNDVQSDPGVHSWILFDLLGGDIFTGTNAPKDLINSILSPLSTQVTTGWNGYYGSLYQINNVISVCERMAPSESRNMTLGEAYYFRAYTYYCLVTRWGGVPVLEKNTLEKVSRNTVAETWAFVEKNLQDAITLLGTSANYYYVSKDAATALLARVKLNQHKKAEAATLAESLINSGKYKLDAFEKIFRKVTNTEIIFAFENLSEESSNNISDLFYSYGHPNKGQGTYKLSQVLVDAFAGSDTRKAMSVVNIAGTNCINKYPSGQTGKDPVIISRLGELYLISAEAQGRSEGLGRLNELRRFRGLTDVTPGSDEAFTEALLQERRLELMGENFRFYDLVRAGKAISTLGILNYQLVLPIPGRELQYNTNLTPNPGY
ncbi:RagB/SusD family nutrient uptake outer membrane protein [Paraflavitalea pollutisoli]|uniref:RagB/SusD family nutrient uptake outer membrane protein n=1 Tax=Paraflavitalea pollutisoli TaxID=3034143 RepID=UPI0023EAA834|nr:RagB/SusD family nutrient uptake outer membrane protein [Paraflavitalea sp. H1-2-19X]